MHPETPRPEKPEIHATANSVHAPYLPGYQLTSLQVICARELAAGRKAIDIKKQFGVTALMWRNWMDNPNFLAAVESRLHRLDQIVEGVLKDGEVQASAVLVAALSAVTPVRHRDGKIRLYPNHEVRTRAAISLLDRQGQRGKPIERVMQNNLNTNSNEVRNEVAMALADPSVRAFLEADPVFAARLREQLLQLPPPQEEAPCEPSVISDASPSPSPSTSSPPPTPLPAPPEPT